jgi:hypothetical protein
MVDADRLGGLETDDQFELGRRLRRKIVKLGAPQKEVDVNVLSVEARRQSGENLNEYHRKSHRVRLVQNAVLDVLVRQLGLRAAPESRRTLHDNDAGNRDQARC